MTRSGYSDDCDDCESMALSNLWMGNMRRAMNGKRGQAFLRELAAALDAMPMKELIAEEIVTSEGQVCAIGSVAVARGLDVSKLDPGDQEGVGKAFGIPKYIAAEIAHQNDDDFGPGDKTPADRWKRVRRWVASQIRPVADSSGNTDGGA